MDEPCTKSHKLLFYYTYNPSNRSLDTDIFYYHLEVHNFNYTFYVHSCILCYLHTCITKMNTQKKTIENKIYKKLVDNGSK